MNPSGTGLRRPKSPLASSHRAPAPAMASRLLAGGQSVTIFEDEPKLVRQLVQEVTETARAAISAKGSFSS